MFEGAFYFFFGVFFTWYIGILFRPKQTLSESEEIHATKFYLNIFLLNTKDVLQNIVRSKISRDKALIRAIAKRVIVNVLNEDFLSKRIGADVCTQLQVKLARKGIKATASIAYQQSAFVCLEVYISPVSFRHFLSKNAHLSGALDKYSKLAALLEWTSFESTVDSIFSNYIGQRMLTEVPNLVTNKLQMKLAAKIELIVCKESEQGEFILNAIQELNQSNGSATPVAIATPVEYSTK
jgi:hypothetical protein